MRKSLSPEQPVNVAGISFPFTRALNVEMPVVSQSNGEPDCALPHSTMAKNAKIKMVLRIITVSCYLPRRYIFLVNSDLLFFSI